MACGARIWNFVLLRGGGRDEVEGVAANEIVGKGLLDFGHVAGQAIVTGAVALVMRMGFQRGGVRPVRRIGAVAFKAHEVAGLDEVGIIFRAVRVMAGVAGDAPSVHHALDKIITLHAVLVGGAVGEMGEGCFAQLVFFQLPEIRQVLSHFEADGPIVSLAGDGRGEGAALRVALDAGVIRIYGREPRGVHNVGLRGAGGVEAAGAVAFFAAHIPLGDLVCFDVKVYGMAAIAGGAGGALHVVVRVESGPPIGSWFHVIRKPFLMRDIPLGFEREIIFAYLGEIALLPFTAVDESDIVTLEFDDGGIGL